MTVFGFVKRVAGKIREYGFASLLFRLLTGRGMGQMYNLGTLKTVATSLPFGGGAGDIPAGTVTWVVPDFMANGSGGHLNIFRTASNLEKLGFANRIVVVESSRHPDGAEAKRVIEDHFLPRECLPLKAEVAIGRGAFRPSEFTIATEWRTAFAVRDFQATRHKCYFVQDYEPYFFPPGSYAVLAESTYRFGFHGITAGGWLSSKLGAEFGMKCDSFGFSYDKKLYVPREGIRRPGRVLFYARPETARRGFELGILALDRLKERMPEVEIVLAGADVSEYVVPFAHVSLGNVPLKDLAELYHTTSVALVLSFTNLSLLPYELMACGCAVVINEGDNNAWGVSEDICSIAPPNPDDLAGALQKLLTDPGLRDRKTKKALEFVRGTDWTLAAKKVADVLGGIRDAKN